MPSVCYRCNGRTVTSVTPGATLLRISVARRIPHWHECGGNGRCTTCRVGILDGAFGLSAPSRHEADSPSAAAGMRRSGSPARRPCTGT